MHEFVHTLSPILHVSISALARHRVGGILYMQRHSNRRATKILKNVADTFCVRSAMFAQPRVQGTVQLIRNPWLCLDQSGDQLGHKLLQGLSKVKLALAAPMRANRDPHFARNKNQIVVSISEPARRRIFLVRSLH